MLKENKNQKEHLCLLNTLINQQFKNCPLVEDGSTFLYVGRLYPQRKSLVACLIILLFSVFVYVCVCAHIKCTNIKQHLFFHDHSEQAFFLNSVRSWIPLENWYKIWNFSQKNCYISAYTKFCRQFLEIDESSSGKRFLNLKVSTILQRTLSWEENPSD